MNDYLAHREMVRNIIRPVHEIYPTITSDSSTPIAEEICYIVAEMLQVWLDAGSERESTMEEIFPAIHDHVASWIDVR